MSVPNFKQIALFIQKLLVGPKISKLGHVTKATPTQWSLYIPYAGGSVLHLCTNFEADCSISSKVIKGSQNLEIRSHYLSHANLGVVLWLVCRDGPSSMSVPNFKRIALFLQKLRFPKISILGHFEPETLNMKSIQQYLLPIFMQCKRALLTAKLAMCMHRVT